MSLRPARAGSIVTSTVPEPRSADTVTGPRSTDCFAGFTFTITPVSARTATSTTPSARMVRPSERHAASSRRVAIGYSISVAIGVVLGLAIGSFASLEAFFEPQIAFLRYIPATALLPLFLLWLGIEESPKIWLIVVGTAFYNVLMIADVGRNVPREMLNASYTLGAPSGPNHARPCSRRPASVAGRAAAHSSADASRSCS